jgi:tRNA A37 threonylcarbamoyladenosine modification protein TsaB|tara:strand:- start:485 stop:910 length:426 start_codon:yes stop_codon:yes gene_type:complete
LLLFVSALEFIVKKIKMKNLIIDAATDRIFFKIISDNESYTSDYPNSRENFDKFPTLLFDFLKENKLNIKEINNIFVNQGPGKFSGIRTSISAAKALSFTNKLNLYGFNSEYVRNQNYDKIIDLFNKGHLIKNLIKPQYSS